MGRSDEGDWGPGEALSHTPRGPYIRVPGPSQGALHAVRLGAAFSTKLPGKPSLWPGWKRQGLFAGAQE